MHFPPKSIILCIKYTFYKITKKPSYMFYITLSCKYVLRGMAGRGRLEGGGVRVEKVVHAANLAGCMLLRGFITECV